jgi:hypothetical protein
VLGRWDAAARTFAEAGTPTNAVRVRARRTTARGGAVPLAFGQVLGLPTRTCRPRAWPSSSRPSPKYAIVGLDSVAMSGGVADVGVLVRDRGHGRPARARRQQRGHQPAGVGYIDGDARPGTGKVVISGGGLVAGSTAPLDATLSYPNATAGAAATTNNNAFLGTAMNSTGSVSYSGPLAVVPGGVYYLNHVSVSGTISFAGPTTIYCYGSFTLSGQLAASGNIPDNLRIVMCPGPGGAAPGAVNISGGSPLYATVYAPQSAVNKSGGNHIYGSIVGRSVVVSGSGTIFYDLSLGTGTPPASASSGNRRT